MRTFTLPFVMAMSGLLVAGCGDSGKPGEPKPPTDLVVATSSLTRDLAPVVSAVDMETFVLDQNTFALELLQEVATGQANAIVSPYSVASAMGMTWAGARGNTAAEIAAALHYTLPPATQHAAFNAFDLALASRGAGASGKDDEPFRLRVANSAWAEKTYTFESDYLDTLAVNYGAGVNLLDFLGAAEESRKTINQWVSYLTESRIPELLPANSVSGDTRLVLTNAVYFNASWATQFNPKETKTQPFQRADGVVVDAAMMRQIEELRYAAQDGWTAVELPYDGDDVALLLVVPDDAFFAFQDAFDTTTLATIDAALAKKRVVVSLPRFEYRQKTEMRAALRNLGITDLFVAGTADLSGIDGGQSLFVSGIFHEAFIALDESGTEAAAATAVVFDRTSGPEELVPAKFDRPFIYLIRDVPTGVIIFAGRVTDPTK